MVAASLLVVVAVDMIAMVALRRFDDRLGSSLADGKWELLESTERDVEWLILGDSSCNQGLDPAVLGSRLGGEALNLCTTADMLAVDDVWMLQRFLEEHRAPRAVFVVHTYDMWHRDTRALTGSMWKVNTTRWAGRDPRVDFSVRDRLLNAIGRWIPLVSRSASLRRLLTEPPVGNQGREPLDEAGFQHQLTPDPASVREDLSRHLAFLQGATFAMSKENEESLAVLGRLSDEHDLPVFIVSAPVLRDLELEPSYQRYVAPLDAQLAAFASNHDQVDVLPHPPGVSQDVLELVDHLVGDGPSMFSVFVAEYAKRHLP